MLMPTLASRVGLALLPYLPVPVLGSQICTALNEHVSDG